MRGRVGSLCVVALAAAAVSAPAAAAEPTPSQAREIGAEAYEYGFPLLEFLRARAEQTSVRCPDRKGNAPVNSFSHARGFPGPEDRTVVAPNTDTLYSIAHLDLKRGPIVVRHPRMGKRYYSFELLDPYTNVIAIPGARENGGDAGRFVVRWKGHPAARGRGRGKRPEGTELIRSRYRRVWIIGRTLAGDERDQRRAKRLMRRYRLKRLGGRARRFGGHCRPGRPEEHPTRTDGAGFLRALGKALAKNPPPAADEALLRRLEPYGIGPGLSPEDAGLAPEVLAALYEGVAAKAASLPSETKLQVYTEALQNQGWLIPAPNIGDYGTDYAFRAFIAILGLGANTREEAIYPGGIADSSGALYDGANRYRLTFAPGEEPPVRYFWSLTMYDLDGFLVANPIDRYSLGPSHPPLVSKPDGSIVVAIQQHEPTEKRVNWLPSPPGSFRLNLRLYGPRKAALNGAWKPPGVVNLGQ